MAEASETTSPGRARRWVFLALAAAFVFTACFHAAAAIDPMIDPEAPTWRHLLFIGINLACVVGFLTRPRLFIPLFALLGLQQIATHGTHAVRLWCREGRVDFPSIAVVLVMPLALYCLVIDAKPSRNVAAS